MEVLRAYVPMAAFTWLMDFTIAARNVVRQKKRSALGLLAIATGIAALIVAAGFIDWIYLSMRESTIGSRLGHIQIVRPGYFEGGAADPTAYLIPDDRLEIERISRLPGVISVAPRLAFSGLISHGDATVSFVGEGIDPVLEVPFDRYVLINAGGALNASDPRGIIVGQGLADNLGVVVGDTVVLVTNKPSGGINAVEATVRGLFATATKAYDDSALRVPIGVARLLTGTTKAQAWVVILDDTERTRTVVDQLGEILAPANLEAVPWYRLADFYNKTVALFSKQVGVLKAIIAIIIILSISNTLTMAVIERTSEIGTSLALGVTRATILRRFICEGIVMGALGGVIGVVAGIGLAFAVSAVGISMPAPPGMARGFTGEVLVTLPGIVEAFALAITTTLIAGIYPAWTASRLEIVDALRQVR